MSSPHRHRAPASRQIRRWERWPRPLDALGSIKLKLGVVIAGAVVVASIITWWGYHHFGNRFTLPLAVLGSLVLTQFLARGMTSPLREMTAAAKAMAQGDYTQRVRATSRDEVGQLAEAFNTMADELASLDTQRRDLVANVSHELRTPIAALQAELENMADGVTEPTPERFEVLLSQTERLGRLVEYTLDASRLEAGAARLEIVSLPLQDFFGEAVSAGNLVAASTGRSVHFAIEVSPRDLSVPADPERMHQVIANLVNNAVRHSPEGGTITLSARREGARVALEVRDEGAGIAPKDRERIFGRFARGTSPIAPSTPATGGTGLGLAIARWIVELHGGSIEVADTPTGCTMRVHLPLHAALT